MTNIDSHDIMMKDVQILQLKREIQDLCKKLNHAVDCLEYYKAQHNGFMAKSVLSVVYDLDYREEFEYGP